MTTFRRTARAGAVLGLASLALVVIAFMVAFATNPTTPVSDQPGSAHVTDPATAQQFDAPEPAPKQPG